MSKNKKNPFGTHRVAKAGQKEMRKIMGDLQTREGLTWEQLLNLNNKQDGNVEKENRA